MTHLLSTDQHPGGWLFGPIRLGLAFVMFAGMVAPIKASSPVKKSPASDCVEIQVTLSEPTMLAGENQTNHLRIALKGTEPADSSDAPTVNVAIVIDTSGSMRGTKIVQARKAAIAAVEQLRDQDIVSVVLYDSTVTVLVPATKAVDREQIISKIDSIQANGNTALFAGVSKGAAEVRKFISDQFVNRVILLSDGQANVGPQSPRELERLGVSLVKEGISVTTLGLGLGYNEDLMSGLAAAGSGNHLFVEEAQNLVGVFKNEFNDLLSVVASDFKIKVTTAANVRPVRVVGTKAEIVGRDVYLPLAQLYGGQERYFVLELEVNSEASDKDSKLVDVEVDYQNLIDQNRERFATNVDVHLTSDAGEVEKDRDYETYAYCTVQIANEANRRATTLRDAGQLKAAKELINQNIWSLEIAAVKCASNNALDVVPELEKNLDQNKVSSKLIESSDWTRNRKQLRAQQYEVGNQQLRRYQEKGQR